MSPSRFPPELEESVPQNLIQVRKENLMSSQLITSVRLCLVLTACAVASIMPLAAQTNKPAPVSEKPSSSAYFLTADDIIEVNVFQETDLQTKARITQAGTITFPLIGEVKIGGMTPEGAAQSIRTLLAKDYLVNPQVSLTITEYSKRRFTVLGQVQKPGAYEMPDRDQVSLLQAIGTAGGYTRIADAGDIRVKRTESGKDVIYKLNAKNIASGKDPNVFVVQTGDIITVGESVF